MTKRNWDYRVVLLPALDGDDVEMYSICSVRYNASGEPYSYFRTNPSWAKDDGVEYGKEVLQMVAEAMLKPVLHYPDDFVIVPPLNLDMNITIGRA